MVNKSAIFVVLGAVSIAVVLQVATSYTGPLELHQRFGSYGGANFATGATNYPRIVDDSEGYALKMLRPTRTVGSQYWSIDEYVYSLVPPETVVAVSESAFEKAYSNVAGFADMFHPSVATDPEVILKVNPDLLLVSSVGRADFTQLLRVAGTPVFRTYTDFTRLDQILQTIRLVGYLTGRDDEAARVEAEFENAIRKAESRKPAGAPKPRVLGFAGRYTYGDQTLFDDILRTLGAVNIGSENGLHSYAALNSEQIILWNPEWIVAGANRGQADDVMKKLLADPAVALTTAAQKGQIVVIQNNVMMPMSPYTTMFLEALGDALYK